MKSVNEMIGVSSAEPKPWFEPDWPSAPNVGALLTTRCGGFSGGACASFNLSLDVGDAEGCVRQNRLMLEKKTGAPVAWLKQTHGTRCVAAVDALAALENGEPAAADACFDDARANDRPVVCAVMTADCLPVLMRSDDGAWVGAAHAGWRGLAAGVLGSLASSFKGDRSKLCAYLGPSISRDSFEVGQDVLEGFGGPSDKEAAQCFKPLPEDGKYLADLPGLARLALSRLGVRRVFGGTECTVIDRDRYYSYRRDGGVTGRQASLVWIRRR